VTAQVQTTCGNHQVLPAMWQRVSHEGPLEVHSAFCIRHRWHPNPAPESVPLLRFAGAKLLDTVPEQEPYHARVAFYLTAKMAALLPFRKAADFPGELLPLSAQATASTVCNRRMKVGRRLNFSLPGECEIRSILYGMLGLLQNLGSSGKQIPGN